MNNNISSKQILISILGVIILIVAVIGISFAAFTYSQAGTKVNTITIGKITMNYTEATNGITLNENQIAALASLQFNCGNINGFLDAYKKYGSTSNLCSNWWEQKALRDSNGTYLVGLKKRRIAECDLFVNNNFNMNVYG